MNKESVHLVASLGWITFAVIIGSLGVAYNYVTPYLWVSIIVAIVGNSSHLVAMSLSKTGLSVQNQTTSTAGKT